MNLADATITQLLIPLDDFECCVSFYTDVHPIALWRSPTNGVFPRGPGEVFHRVMPAAQKAQLGND